VADLTALALNAARTLSVAELHGAACGLACCGMSEDLVQDLVDLVGAEAVADAEAVETFVSASIGELMAEDLSFMPLLPDEEAALADRVVALGEWCGSYLAGLAAGLTRLDDASLDDLPLEVREIVQDFAAITDIDPDLLAAAPGAGAANAEEADYAQLQEFVKVGVLLVMSMLLNEPDDQTG
jgi:uncharacterized protein YgfB (UPF0149 family)